MNPIPFADYLRHFDYDERVAIANHLRGLNELPKDKLLVLACPHTDRSNMARSYLVSRGFNAKYLQGGLLALMDRLKGVGAQDICLER